MSFPCEELPSDMKMLAMLGREVSNSAKFFSSFANVSTNDCTDLSGTFGSSPSCKWKPWEYSSRLKVVEKVDSLKYSLTSLKYSLYSLSRKQKRTTATEFIACQSQLTKLM